MSKIPILKRLLLKRQFKKISKIVDSEIETVAMNGFFDEFLRVNDNDKPLTVGKVGNINKSN